MGNTGLWISSLSFGSWVTYKNQVDQNLSDELLAMAYDHGINFFDNAEVYAKGDSEVLMGQSIKNLGWSRDSFCVSSKVFWGGDLPTQRGLNRKHIFDACHAALDRLQVDYLDLFFCHRPDFSTPVEETVRAMSDLVSQGKVMYWGTSEWPADRIVQAHMVAKGSNLVAPAMEQCQYNMFHRDRLEREYHQIFNDLGMGTTIWSPLASGLLTGKYAQGIPKNARANIENLKWFKTLIESEEGKIKIAKVEKLRELAESVDTSVACLALAWCLTNKNVSTVILGASKKEQLEENLKALDVVPKFTRELITDIEGILNNRPEAQPNFLLT